MANQTLSHQTELTNEPMLTAHDLGPVQPEAPYVNTNSTIGRLNDSQVYQPEPAAQPPNHYISIVNVQQQASIEHQPREEERFGLHLKECGNHSSNFTLGNKQSNSSQMSQQEQKFIQMRNTLNQSSQQHEFNRVVAPPSEGNSFYINPNDSLLGINRSTAGAQELYQHHGLNNQSGESLRSSRGRLNR